MSVRSPTQPYCRCCGKPIPKATDSVYFGRSQDLHDRSPTRGYLPDKPTTKEEAQRLVNAKIISVKRWAYQGEDYVHTVGTWDGESYRDATFCTARCAEAFGRMAARLYPDLETSDAYQARQARENNQ
jgi:hypothetical protein